MFGTIKRSSMSGIFAAALIAAFVLTVTAMPVYAHGPSSVTLQYDQGKQTLSVTVTHAPFNADSHFVKEIEILKNGKAVGTYAYKGQPGETFTQTYPVPAAAGDVLEAKATCSKYGSRTGKLTVGK